MSSKPFDLGKMDYDTLRRQRRKRYLLRAGIPLVIALLAAIWFILPSTLNTKSIGAYDDGNFAKSRSWLSPLTISSPEQFVIAFNSGTVDTQLGNYERAEEELTRALAIAPDDKRCMAAQNLVTSLQAHAAAKTDDEKLLAELDSKVTTVMGNNEDCFKGSAASGGGSSASSSSDSQSPDDSQQQQLEQKEEEGRERQAKFAREETFEAENPKIKPW